MQQEKMDGYKKVLLAEREQLMGKMKEHANTPDFGDDVDSFDEEKNEAEAVSNEVAIVQSMRERINEIQTALDRIEAGTYGVCRSCGKMISEDLLSSDAAIAVCSDCR